MKYSAQYQACSATVVINRNDARHKVRLVVNYSYRHETIRKTALQLGRIRLDVLADQISSRL